MKEIQIVPTGGALGAEIRGLDLRDSFSAPEVSRLRSAFHQYAVLLFRGQRLTERDQVRFSRVFGQPVRHPVSTQPPGPVEEITVISNIEKDGKPIGALGNQEVQFHADLAFRHAPGSFSMLYAVQVPPVGGDTMWINGYAAYEALADADKARLRDIRVIYVHPRPEYNPPQPVAHPLICIHPETGRKTIYLSPSHARSIVGLDALESQNLLTRVIAHVTQPRFIWTHQWRANDLIVWDNRCTMHRRESFDNSQRRLMKRTQGISVISI